MSEMTPASPPSGPVLRCSFQHLPGISASRESKLRSAGLRDWNDLLEGDTTQLDLFRRHGSELRSAVEASEKALARRDVEFFRQRLPRREYYRIAASFPEQCVFLDIESTGLSQHYDHVTLIGWSMGRSYRVLVDPDDTRPFERGLRTQPVVITFNGTLFDLPFLRSKFNIDWSRAIHVDLRYLARRVGLTGGQKKIELSIDHSREAALEGITGAQAVELWFDYKEGDLNALRQLIRYNHADIEGMKFVFEHVLNTFGPEKGVPMENGELFERSSVRFADTSSAMGENVVPIMPYRGRVGPRLVLGDLRKRAPRLDDITVVGIDLTGSQERKSGWAAVTGGEVVSELAATDAELIERTVAAKPFLVSIDSPLSLPTGRMSEFDDDPGRKKYGIVRDAERQLRKRGINVYPALLPSMQRLTRRGVELAACLRKKGIPVIESYPGAAQDILGIPRKKTSLKHLIEGLRRYGYGTLSLNSAVSHDELDAATSALVGQFMLAGYWEALGSSEEDYLIVPTVDRRPGDLRPEVVVGLSGLIAAGKTTAGRILERSGFRYCRFSELLQDELVAQGTPVTRNALQALGEDVYNGRFGQRRLQNRLANKVEGAGKIVVDGLRHPEDSAFLRERWGLAAVHVHICAGQDLRKTRYANGLDGLGGSFSRAVSHPVERNAPGMERFADCTVDNSGAIEELEIKLDALVERWSSCRSQ